MVLTLKRSARSSMRRLPLDESRREGKTLRQVETPDQTLVHSPTACAGCGGSLKDSPVVSLEARQVFDLPPIVLRVVEHRLEHRRCGCGQVTMADAPAGVGAPAQYGPAVRGLATPHPRSMALSPSSSRCTRRLPTLCLRR